MGRFKSKPTQLKSRVRDIERFTQGASTRSSKVKAPWSNFDPRDKPTSGINLRLNDYELTLIRYVAESEDRSIQKTLKRLLVPALEAEVKRL